MVLVGRVSAVGLVGRVGVVVVLGLSTAALTAHAQTPAASIRGRVVAAGTDIPLRNARVELRSEAASIPPTFTDRDGRFVFRSLVAGKYSLVARKTGYVSGRVNQEPLARFDVPAGMALDAGDIGLVRSAAISGRIIDSYGDPIVGLTVRVERLPADRDSSDPVIVIAGQTDDLGEYRFGNLSPGRLVVSTYAGPAITGVNGTPLASTMGFPTMVDGVLTNVTADSARARCYWPGVANVADAEVIILGPGDDKTFVDFLAPSTALRMLESARGIAQAGAPATRGDIRGRVTRDDGRPLPQAVVRLSSTGSSSLQPRTAVTDDEGRYEFLAVPPGIYTAAALRAGFVTRGYGPRHSAPPGEPIEIASGESHDNVDFSLPVPGAISGAIVDENGEPIGGADVRALQVQYNNGRRRLVGVSGGGSHRRTDDRGRYRLYGLSAGEYIVRAIVEQANVTPTYFPGAANPGDGRVVSFDLGQHITGVDIAMARVPTVVVAGTMFDSAGNTVSGTLTLTPSGRAATVVDMPAIARTNRDGAFEFPSVPAGTYVLKAWKQNINSWTEGEFTSQLLTVTGGEISGMVVRLSAGSTIRGRITSEAGILPSGQVTLSPIAVDSELSPLGGPQEGNPLARAQIDAEGTFEMAGINGPRRVTVTSAPEGWTLKTVLVNGIDMTDVPLPFGSKDQSIDDVEVVLTGRGAEVSGRVTDARGRPASDATVVVFATDRERWFPESRFQKVATPGRDGGFAVRGLAAGEYFVAAVDRIQPDEWRDPEFLETMVSTATRVTVAEGQKLPANPKLVVR